MKKVVSLTMVLSLVLCVKVLGQSEMTDRGVVAIQSDDNMFISWRLFQSDPEGIGFNVYRSNEDENLTLVNETPITQGTNFVDETADLSKSNAYAIVPVSPEGIELNSANARTAGTNEVTAAQANTITVNLRNGPEIHFAWVGDLDGDGDYDYIIDRLDWGNRCYLEAYSNDGTFLWDIDYGPNSANTDNISPGSATIDVGHWDGVTVADLDGDGQAEVITKVAPGVRLGNGFVWGGSNNNHQWLVVLDGSTGGWRADARIPDDYISTGPVACQLGVGNNNEIFLHAKNRNSNGSFNAIDACYTFSSSNLSLKWKETGGFPQGHQIRVVDVNEDGVDDLAHIGFVRDGNNGSILYRLDNIIHGDRWHIGKFDPDRPGLQGYGVQQNSPGNIIEYYYDASNGEILWTHPGGYDNGRGNAADIDPRYPGYEVWSFEGIYNGPTNTQITQEPDRPWPNFRIWWDGDNGSELYDNGEIEAWDYNNNWTVTLEDVSDYGATGSYRGAPLFYGDFLGDWREEVILRNSSNNQLIILTTDIPTSISRPSLMEDRYYRNDLTVKGYMQSHHTSYYIGEGGNPPPPGEGTYEAEDYSAQSGTSIESNHSGYTGSGFVDYGGAGTWIEWNNIDGEGGGSATLTFRYANGSTENRSSEIRVNGTDIGELSFAPTGSWSTWDTQSISASLSSGNNTIRVTSIGSGPNLDNLSVSVSSDGSYVQFENRGTGLRLDGLGRTTNGDACGQYANTNHQNSHWELVDVGSGYYQLRNRGTGMYLDGMGRTTDGDDVGQWANTTHQNSHWSIQQYDGSYYRLQNRSTGLYLDGLGRTTNGDAVGQWANATSHNAQWQMISVGSGSREVLGALDGSETILIYPNPMNEVLNIRLEDNDGSAVAKIFNVSGQVVMSRKLTGLDNQIKVQKLPGGIYFVEVMTPSGIKRSKLIKQ